MTGPLHRTTVATGALSCTTLLVGLLTGLPAQAATGTYTQGTAIAITDNGAAMPYPSNIDVSGLPKGITDVNVTLSSWDHTYPDEVDVLLVGPGGQLVELLSDVGGPGEVSGVNLTLDDAATQPLPDATAPTSGTYRPTDYEPADTAYPAPAPDPGTTPSSLAAFNGTDPNGTWHLYVRELTENGMTLDSGDFDGWSLTISTVDVPAAPVVSSPTSGRDTDGDFIIAGTAQAGTSVKIYEGATPLATTVASSTGTWALALLDQSPGIHAYTATATDAYGNVSPLSAVKSVAVDVVHPSVLRTAPRAGADDVRRGRNVRAWFSEPVRPVTITGANVRLVRVATGATVRATLRYDVDSKSVVINPRRDLAANARYKVVIGTGVKDLAGNRLDQNPTRSGNQAKVWRFSTR